MKKTTKRDALTEVEFNRHIEELLAKLQRDARLVARAVRACPVALAHALKARAS